MKKKGKRQCNTWKAEKSKREKERQKKRKKKKKEEKHSGITNKRVKEKEGD